MTDLEAVEKSIEHWEENLENLKNSVYMGKFVAIPRLIVLFDEDKNIIANFYYGGDKCQCCQVAVGRNKKQKKAKDFHVGGCVDLCPAGKVLGTDCYSNGWSNLNSLCIPRLSMGITDRDKEGLIRVDQYIIFVSEVILTWLTDAKLVLTQKGKNKK